MRVLVACEFSGVVREAFRAMGHEAWSCDLRPADDGSRFHIQDDVRFHLKGSYLSKELPLIKHSWDLMIAHPPCTYLCVSGMHRTTRGLRDPQLTVEALDFVQELLSAPIQCIALENPVGVISTQIRKPDQIIQPHQFGHDASKQTCLWLKNLPKLISTANVPPRIVDGKKRWANQTDSGQNRLPPSDDRWAKRSLTYPGIADAMADQWGRAVMRLSTSPSRRARWRGLGKG